MAVSQHAQKALDPGVAHFDSFSLSQEPSPRWVLHEWGQRAQHSYWLREPGASRNWPLPLKKAHFVAGEYGGVEICFCTAEKLQGRLDLLSSQWRPRSLKGKAEQAIDCHPGIAAENDLNVLYADTSLCFVNPRNQLWVSWFAAPMHCDSVISLRVLCANCHAANRNFSWHSTITVFVSWEILLRRMQYDIIMCISIQAEHYD